MTEAHIPRKVLTEKVSHTGRDFFGRKSTITFSPTKEHGWYWNTGTDIVPIDHRILRLRKRHLVLVHGKAKFHVYEHIGVLRFLGFDSIVITCPSGWPPYDARPFEVWEKLSPYMEEDGYIPFKSLDLEGRGSNKIGYTMFNQVTSPELSARIDVDYKGIDSGSLVWNSDKQYELLEYLKAPAPVYPQWIRYPAKAGELVGIWKHSNRVSWPHLTEPRAWVENALRQRIRKMNIDQREEPGHVPALLLLSVRDTGFEPVAYPTSRGRSTN